MEKLNPRLLSWASLLDDQTRAQAEQASAMPFIHPHIALMPDAHLGMGATVGSVIPTRAAVMPAAVGVDIGCGMEAVLTQWTGENLRAAGRLSQLRVAIEQAVPLSAGRYNTSLTPTARSRVKDLEELAAQSRFQPRHYTRNWAQQLGSLGSGNHFIEVSADEEDRVWLFLHSGSRGVGNKIASHHIKVAQRWCGDRGVRLPHRDLAYLEEGTDEFRGYIGQLRWAQEFARQNRAEMMDRVAGCLAGFTGEETVRVQEVSCHHNYTEREEHFGETVWLSRKGAIDATAGTWGLIPGSMGTPSYVVVGKGNAEALNSAPHGAGRAHSRTAARRRFSPAQLEWAMAGIEWSGSAALLDEIPAAYKDINQVMADAADLVDTRHTLTQLVSVKGD